MRKAALPKYIKYVLKEMLDNFTLSICQKYLCISYVKMLLQIQHMAAIMADHSYLGLASVSFSSFVLPSIVLRK